MIFVTSFDEQLFEVSGKHLLESFSKFQPNGTLLCYYEGAKPSAIDGTRILGYDITKDPNVVEWDEKYRERCEKQSSYWRRRAWQWYRKVLSQKLACDVSSRWLVWVDCDCAFKAEITPEFLESTASGHRILYLLGSRPWTETGVILFDRVYGAADRFLEQCLKTYQSGEFLDLDRWDDCWVFDHVRSKFDPSYFLDIARCGVGLRVVESSLIGGYLSHDKGSHLRKGVRR